jgi:hypothetical protein
MEKKIANYFVNWSIDNATDKALPYSMAVEINRAIHTYARNYYNNQDFNKARAFEYLQKILIADMREKDFCDFMNIFTERDNVIVYAGGLSCYDDDYIIIAFHNEIQINVYAFRTYNECNTFEMFEYEEE